MNENINLCNILKGHEGKVFYSPVFGDLIFVCVIYPNVRFKTVSGDIWDIKSNGKIYNDSYSLCVYPSIDQQDWNKWNEERNAPKTWSELVKENKYQAYFAEIHIRFVSEDKCAYGKNPIEKSAAALIKIHQLIEVGYSGNVSNELWYSQKDKWIITPIHNKESYTFTITRTAFFTDKCHIAFHTKEQAEEFLEYPENIQLLKDYFMI